jgi:hypothetical protein
VTTNIIGKPVVQVSFRNGVGNGFDGDEEIREMETVSIPESYPTRSFTSWWNCILDLSPQHHRFPAYPTSNEHDHKQK